MLKRYIMFAGIGNTVYAADVDGADPQQYEDEVSPAGWVRYEDAEALQMRVIELEQKLKTQDELKAEFELDCAADCDCKR